MEGGVGWGGQVKVTWGAPTAESGLGILGRDWRERLGALGGGTGGTGESQVGNWE